MLREAPLAAFAEFARHMLDSWDIDPVYPVLRQLIEDEALDPPQAEWLVILYLAYYEVTSALTAFWRYPDPAKGGPLADRATLKLPTGIERRGLRQPDLMRYHLMDWLQRFDGESFFTAAREAFFSDPYRNDDVLDQYLQGVRYNGRWASYKAREVVHKVLDFPNAAPDAGHENSTGPREGLTLFFPAVRGNGPRSIAQLNEQTRVLIEATRMHGVDLTVEEVETLLCDFKSLSRGRYYVGHDTDLMLEGILRPGIETVIQEALIFARRSLPHHYRGEVNGRWSGRDREAMTAYTSRGEVWHRTPPHGRWAT